MNILRSAEGGSRKTLAVLGVAGALALAHSDAPRPKLATLTPEAQKDNYLKQVAIKISGVIICMQGKDPNIQAYPSFRGPAVMASIPSNGNSDYELNTIIAKGKGDSMNADRTMAVAIFSDGLKNHGLKIVSANPAEEKGFWVSVSRSIDHTADPSNQYDPMYVGRLPGSDNLSQQMRIANLAWKETEVVATSGGDSSCLPRDS